VVVVRDRGPLGAILLLITILSIVSIVLLFLILLNGRGSVFVVAIPGFPLESILVGLILGVLLVVARARRRRVGN